MLSAHRRGAIHLFIIERREGCNHGNSKRLLPGDEIAGEHAPGALRVANPNGAGKAIDRDGKLHALLENFVSQRFRQFDASRAAVMASRAIGNVGPAFQENAAMPILLESRMPQHSSRRAAFMHDAQPPSDPHNLSPRPPPFSPHPTSTLPPL